MRTQARLIDKLCRNLKPGKLQYIGLRPIHRAPVISVAHAIAIAGLGLEGDHRIQKTPGSARQITIISSEFISQIEHFTGLNGIDPALLRRNLVVSGVNLNAFRHQRFNIGCAEFEATAWCHPCSRMEKALGAGAVAAMLGYGGLCAKILKGGEIRVGDSVEKIDQGLNEK